MHKKINTLSSEHKRDYFSFTPLLGLALNWFAKLRYEIERKKDVGLKPGPHSFSSPLRLLANDNDGTIYPEGS